MNQAPPLHGDIYSKEKRSQVMAAVKSFDTKPEIVIRSSLHRHGFRFRVNVKELPGKPDIVLPKYRTLIFINGCFWHGHANCNRAKMPKLNKDYWRIKIQKNIKRDNSVQLALIKQGWKIIVIWTCEIKFAAELNAWLFDAIRSCGEGISEKNDRDMVAEPQAFYYVNRGKKSEFK